MFITFSIAHCTPSPIERQFLVHTKVGLISRARNPGYWSISA